MIVIQPIPNTQQIVIFARAHSDPGEDYSVLIRDEEAAKDHVLTFPGIYDGVRLTLDIEFNFTEGRWYMMKVYHPTAGDTLNYSKIYATAQTQFAKYSVLNDYYKQIEKPESEYIVKK